MGNKTQRIRAKQKKHNIEHYNDEQHGPHKNRERIQVVMECNILNSTDFASVYYCVLTVKYVLFFILLAVKTINNIPDLTILPFLSVNWILLPAFNNPMIVHASEKISCALSLVSVINPTTIRSRTRWLSYI